MTAQFDLENVRAMIVDDHDPIRKAMKRVLTKLGVKHIVECFDGSEALKALSEQTIDLILLDIYMRKVDGFKVLESVRNRSIRSDIPIVVVTGESTKESIVKASDLGADDYIIKPFQVDSMVSKVQQVLNNFFSPPPLLSALRRADRLTISKNYDEALGAYQEALDIEPESMRAKHSIAVVQDFRGKSEEAIRLLEKNIDEAPSYYKNFQTLANIHLKNEQYAKAISALKKELDLNPKQASRQIQMAKLLVRQGDPLTAIEHYRAALKEEPKSKMALVGMGKCHASLEELERSMHFFKKARRYHHAETSILKVMTKVCLDAGKPKVAENALKDEKSLHPERKDLYVQLSHLYSSLGRHEEADAILEELLKIDPINHDGLVAKAKNLIKKKEHAEALEIFNSLARSSPSVEIFFNQARCLLPLGQIRDCINTLHKAIALDSTNGSVFLLAATAYRRSQQLAKAHICLSKAMALGSPKKKCLSDLSACISSIKARRAQTT